MLVNKEGSMKYLFLCLFLVGCAAPASPGQPDCSDIERDIAAVLMDMQTVTSFRPELQDELARLRDELRECMD